MCPLSPLILTLLWFPWAAGLCINTGYISTNMILACSRGLRGSFDCLSINIHINLSASSLSLFSPPPLPLLSVSLLPGSPRFFLSQQTLTPLISYLLPYLQATTEQSDGDESHGAVFLVAWWQPVLGPFLSDSRSSCLGASCLFPGLAGPAQPVSLHDDHWLTVQPAWCCQADSHRLNAARHTAFWSPDRVLHVLVGLQGGACVYDEFGLSVKVLGAVTWLWEGRNTQCCDRLFVSLGIHYRLHL